MTYSSQLSVFLFVYFLHSHAGSSQYVVLMADLQCVREEDGNHN